MPKAYTNDYFYEQMKKIHNDISITGEYINGESVMHCIHICGYEWDTKANILMHGHGCPKCNHSIQLTQQDFEDIVSKSNPNVLILGKYVNQKTKVEAQCKIDWYKWMALPGNLERGQGCPLCANKVVVQGYNDIATTRPDLVIYFVDKNETNLYTANSHHVSTLICPDCLHQRKMTIKQLSTQGFTCNKCGDSISTPNKIACGLLSQLSLDEWIREYCPAWSNNKKYDNYFVFNGNKYILEMDGDFHFKNNQMSKMTVVEARQIDEYKDKLASSHNIHVIRINCNGIGIDRIIQNIIDSELAEIFDLNKIDWNICYKFAATNFIKMACEYYEANKFKKSNGQIAKALNISVSTLRSYRKIGSKFNWCKKLNRKEYGYRLSIISNNSRSVAVIVKDLNDTIVGTYKSINLCAKEMSNKYGKKFYGSSISKAIRLRNGIYNNLKFSYI